MGIFEMVVAIVLIGTLGKVAQTFAARGPATASEREVRQLREAVEASDARLMQTEERVAELSEKLNFMENLLADPGRQAELPPTRTQAPPVHGS